MQARSVSDPETASTQERPKRDASGRWVRGTTGNPKGRPVGSGVVFTVRQELKHNIRVLCDMLWKQAMAGDVGAARLLLDRAMPVLKPTDEVITFNLPDADIVTQARSVLQAVADGVITPSQAGEVLSSMSAVAKVVETFELEKRITELEAPTLSST